MSKPYPELVEWLKGRGAYETKFGEDFLLDHLEGVHRILLSHHQPQPVCLAGLFYSIYDAKSFTADSLPLGERGLVLDLIGREAEQLVWLSGQLDRANAYPHYVSDPLVAKLALLDGTEMVVDANELGSSISTLLTIECAVLLERQLLWRNQWLVPYAKQVGFLTTDGDQPNHAVVDAHLGQMLAQAKQALTLELIEGINFQRKNLASSYWWGDNLRSLKAKQAKLILQSNGQMDSHSDIQLVSHYATVNELTLLAAAQDISARADAFDAKLVETEMLKDSLLAEIKRAKNFEDIERVRAVLDEKA